MRKPSNTGPYGLMLVLGCMIAALAIATALALSLALTAGFFRPRTVRRRKYMYQA